ncbi:hypothetical protein [Granulicella mallensis]|uniref:DUF4136 domain-containing protein n=1 Tax=Granulicella mallensis (strain ATCC BAA-1857 / DSM 23137 / MP5ACTX8) TaxID=682795 RepID=G8NR70_GRAMM|nr:hypothetical protein [Granulicella mallensis]AEU36148.1 hypothetical protein AciX8_1811 [Granulicella mallensis MP5ACTX8]
MNALIRRPLLSLCLLLLLLTVACLKVAPPPSPPPSPDVIARMTSAKKIFLSNGGEDHQFVRDIPGGPNEAYNELYASLKQWGRFQLVASPAQADLIFEIHGAERPPDLISTSMDSRHSEVTYFPAFLNLSVLDPSTQSSLYVITIWAGRDTTIPKGKIAFTKSIGTLTDRIKAVVSGPAQTPQP